MQVVRAYEWVAVSVERNECSSEMTQVEERRERTADERERQEGAGREVFASERLV